MHKGLQEILTKATGVLNELESGLQIAVNEVLELKTTNASEYADAILDQNGFGGDTAEIYFSKYAPEGYPAPHDREEYTALMNNSVRKKDYEFACYHAWKDEIQKVQKIVERYGGVITVNDLSLDEYISIEEENDKIPLRERNYKIRLKVGMSAHQDLRKLRHILELHRTPGS